jgi:hypothetical protein
VRPALTAAIALSAISIAAPAEASTPPVKVAGGSWSGNLFRYPRSSIGLIVDKVTFSYKASKRQLKYLKAPEGLTYICNEPGNPAGDQGGNFVIFGSMPTGPTIKVDAKGKYSGTWAGTYRPQLAIPSTAYVTFKATGKLGSPTSKKGGMYLTATAKYTGFDNQIHSCRASDLGAVRKS